jgi:uncharacterized protein
VQPWRRFDGTKIHQDIVTAVKQIIIAEMQQGYQLQVCIGTDSQVKNSAINFATVIVFKRKNKGAFMLIQNEILQRKMAIKERMLYEVSKSIDIAFKLTPLFIEFAIDMEVHADINTNPNFKSNTALKEAMGFILGMGFAFKAKPQAFASTSCANKMVQ